MYHAYAFDREIVQSKQRKCASTCWSSFFWMNPAFTYAGIMLSMNCFFFPMKPSHDNGGELEFWDASPTKSVVHESW